MSDDRDPGSPGQFLSQLFDTSDFPERWHCGQWTSFDGWTHVVADSAIFGAYFAIPLVIGYFVWRRRDLPFPRVAYLFAAFILACGATHLIDATLFWHPWYRVFGAAKVATASISWLTVVALIGVLPAALALPGRAALGERLAIEVVERRRAAEQLEERNADLDRFATAASHDLQAPLRGIFLLAQFLEEDEAERLSPEGRENLRQLRHRAQRMQSLVRGLLDYARVGAERSPTESVDVRRVVQEVIRSIDPRPGFEVRSSGALPTLETQRVPLERVFQNLLQNALTHHDRDRGLVTVSSELRDGVVHFTVADDGPGIPESDRERIFEMFSRLTPDSPGTGIGLALVARDVQSRGGRIWVEDNQPRGLRVQFTWPTTPSHSADPAALVPA